MPSRRSSLAALAIVPVTLALLANAQDAAPDGTAERRRLLAARVARLRGRALVQQPGQEAWRALGDQALLGTGDRVKAEGGPVELVLPGDEAAVRDTSQDGGDRVVLAPDARVTIAPPSGADVRLDQGELWAVGAGGLDVEAGGDRVDVGTGEAGIELGRAGGIEVTVHSGEVRVRAGTEERTASGGERITVDARGARVTRAPAKRPPWLAALDQVDPQAILLHEEFRVWPGAWHDHWGDRTAEGALRSTTMFVGEEPPAAEDERSEVRFGRSSSAGGLFTLRAGARVRVRYRLSAVAPLCMRLNSAAGRVDSGVAPARASAGWSEVEFRPEQMAPAGRLTDGVLVTYLSVIAGAFEGPTPTLEVSRILVYVAR